MSVWTGDATFTVSTVDASTTKSHWCTTPASISSITRSCVSSAPCKIVSALTVGVSVGSPAGCVGDGVTVTVAVVWVSAVAVALGVTPGAGVEVTVGVPAGPGVVDCVGDAVAVAVGTRVENDVGDTVGLGVRPGGVIVGLGAAELVAVDNAVGLGNSGSGSAVGVSAPGAGVSVALVMGLGAKISPSSR
jgi:hypothetical protein